MDDALLQKGLVSRLYWLAKLRWMAVVGVLFAITLAGNVFGVRLSSGPLYSIAGFIAIYNLVFLIILSRVGKNSALDIFLLTNKIANLEISFDLASLAALIHFAGGIENPFVFYFIFHMIIAGILLSRRAAYLQATFAVILFSLVVALEHSGALRHYGLVGFVEGGLYRHSIYEAGVSFVFISTMYIAVYMATSISGRLRAREKSLREANELLVQKDRLKSEYVLRVTHDIKEHLAAVQSCIEPVTSGITGVLNDKQKDLLQRADNRTGKLLLFVKKLLEITEIKLAGPLEAGEFHFETMLREAIEEVSVKAGNKNISVRYSIDRAIDKIKGSEDYIQETVINLIANAIKYTPENGNVDIAAEDKGGSILIKIKDSGIGIPEGELGHIFEEFYRASNAKKTERDGSGLGLAIARQIIERHNGKIWVESREGEGSTFFITLPK